ncbi:hypothetical protein A2U01_0097245, partial [Trifolium medium]|nr:hypothetical protein [Trifolium medium]
GDGNGRSVADFLESGGGDGEFADGTKGDVGYA